MIDVTVADCDKKALNTTLDLKLAGLAISDKPKFNLR